VAAACLHLQVFLYAARQGRARPYRERKHKKAMAKFHAKKKGGRRKASDQGVLAGLEDGGCDDRDRGGGPGRDAVEGARTA
jgi:hypothetical protein